MAFTKVSLMKYRSLKVLWQLSKYLFSKVVLPSFHGRQFHGVPLKVGNLFNERPELRLEDGTF